MFFFKYVPYNLKVVKMPTIPLLKNFSIVSEFAMKPSEDKIYHAEYLYNGMTEEQRFQKYLAEGRYKYIGEVIKFNEIRKSSFSYILGGPPRPKQPLIRIEEVLYKYYKGSINTYREPKLIRTWTPEEWEERNKSPYPEKYHTASYNKDGLIMYIDPYDTYPYLSDKLYSYTKE